jgi:hypothetical protein
MENNDVPDLETILRNANCLHEIALMIETRLQADATSRWSRRARRGYTWEQIYRKAIDPMIKEVTA